MTRRTARDDGAAVVEFVGVLPVLVIVSLAVWQLLLTAGVVTAAEHAARTGARAASLGRDGEQVAVASVTDWLKPNTVATTGGGATCDSDGGSGERVVVCIDVPILFPALSIDGLTVHRAAEFAREPTP